MTEKIVIGTAAHVDVKFKCQESVLKAIRVLKDKYNIEVRYEIIGGGNPSRLKAISNKLGVDEQVSFLGLLPHNKTFEWYDHIDIYVHPSLSEGLCRSIIEAMSRGLPVIACDVGGNYELIEREFLFVKGNYYQLADILQEMIKPTLRLEQAKRNFERALLFQKSILDLKRDIFYKEFANGE